MMALLGLILVVSIWSDVSCRRIPNWLIVFGLAGGLIGVPLLRLVHMGEWVWWPYAGCAAGLLTLMPLYLLRACGAGDAKLMAVVGAFVGPDVVVQAAFYTVLSGGVLSLVFMCRPGVAAQTFHNLHFLMTDWVVRLRTGGGARLAPIEVTAARMPYAVAIAAGTAIAVWRHGLP